MSCLSWALALPGHLCPSFTASIPLPQTDRVTGTLPPPSGPLVLAARWAGLPWVQGSITLPRLLVASGPLVQPLKGFGFLTTAEGGLLCLETQPHRSFHDIVSRGGGNIKGPGDRFLSRCGGRVWQSPTSAKGLALALWPLWSGSHRLRGGFYVGLLRTLSFLLYRRYHSPSSSQNLSPSHPCLLHHKVTSEAHQQSKCVIPLQPPGKLEFESGQGPGMFSIHVIFS